MAVCFGQISSTLPGSGLVGCCPETVFFADTDTATIFIPHCQFGNSPRGDSEKPSRSTKKNIGPCKAQSCNGPFNEDKTCLKI